MRHLEDIAKDVGKEQLKKWVHQGRQAYKIVQEFPIGTESSFVYSYVNNRYQDRLRELNRKVRIE